VPKKPPSETWQPPSVPYWTASQAVPASPAPDVNGTRHGAAGAGAHQERPRTEGTRPWAGPATTPAPARSVATAAPPRPAPLMNPYQPMHPPRPAPLMNPYQPIHPPVHPPVHPPAHQPEPHVAPWQPPVPPERKHGLSYLHGHFSLSKQARLWFIAIDLVLALVAAAVLMVVTNKPAAHHVSAQRATAPTPAASALLVGNETTAFPTSADTPPPPVVIVGDSNAWLWQLYAPGIPNLGRIGQDTAQIQETIPEALAFHPKYVVITAGTIDLLIGATWQETIAHLQSMANEVRAGGATPIFLDVQSYGAAMLTAPWIGIGLWPPSVGPEDLLKGNDQVAGLNAAIAQLGVPYLAVPPDSLTIDGEHLNATGYATINKELQAITGPLPSVASAFVTQAAGAMPTVPGTARPTTVIVGDVNAWLWQLYAPAYPNLARIGESAAQVAASIGAALAYHPKWVVITAGTTDLLEGASWQATAANLQALVNQVRAGGATPILVEAQLYGPAMQTKPWQTMGLWPSSLGASLPVKGSDQVAALDAAMATMGVPVLAPLPASDTFDGLHLTGIGYEALNKELLQVTG
jgi:lysophospholipase L1-like esterase